MRGLVRRVSAALRPGASSSGLASGGRSSRRRSWVLAASLALAATAASAADSVVLIVLCSVRADRLGCYGARDAETPSIDRLASEGVLFQDAVAAANWTRPSVASILTSVYPSEHRVRARRPEDVMPPDVVTLAEAFRERGYRTGAFLSQPDCPAHAGFARGFDEFRNAEALKSDAWRRGSLEWLRAVDGPSFLLLVIGEGHLSAGVNGPVYAPRPDCREAFARRLAPADYPWGAERIGFRFDGARWSDFRRPPDEAEKAAIRRLYDVNVSCVDRQVGEYLDELRELGLYDRSLVAVMSDHGEGLFDHGLLTHAGPHYDELMRVALIVKRPGGTTPGRRVKDQVRTIDVAPTVMELAGAGVPERALLAWRGTSVAGAADGRRYRLDACAETDQIAPIRSLRTRDGWKLIVDRRHDVRELYDLRRDPGERNNLYGRAKRRAGRMEERLLTECPEEREVSPGDR
jgi:arylsulfatase A-like enzyme